MAERLASLNKRCAVAVAVAVLGLRDDATPGTATRRQQRRALVAIVDAVRRGANTFGVTDYRWFNLRDNLSSTRTFGETSGLLTDAYRRKPAFAAYRSLIARYGVGR